MYLLTLLKTILHMKLTFFRAVFEHDLTDALTGRFSASYSDHDKLYQCLYASGYDRALSNSTLQGYVDTTQRSTPFFLMN